MIVYKNYNERLYFGCFIGALIGVLVFGIALLYYQKTISGYVQVEATVEGIMKESEQSGNTVSYVFYSYTYRDKEYIGKRQILFSIGDKTGKKTVIRINPEQPDEIEDIMRQKIFLASMGICIFAMLLLLKPTVGFIRKYIKIS